MFNREIKERFIQYKQSTVIVNAYFYKNLFGRTEEFEEKLNKDVSNFTYYDIENMYKTFSFASIDRLNVVHSTLKIYTDWCIAEGLVSDYQNHFLEVDQQTRYDYINVAKQEKQIVSRETILDWCGSLPNATDAFRLLALFEGLHGKDFSDITGLTIDNVDKKHNQIILPKRTINVSSKLILYAEEANKEEVYSALTGKMEREIHYEMSRLVVKKTLLVRNNSEKQERQRFLVHSSRIYRYIGVDQWVTNTTIINSGVIDFINTKAKEKGISGKDYVFGTGVEEIKHQFDKSIVRSVFCDRFKEYLV